MPRCVVFLQNAYSEIPQGPIWEYDKWFPALQASRTGKRLERIFPYWSDVYFANTTFEIGDNPDSQLPPHWEYMRSIVLAQNPKVILACGKQAEQALLDNKTKYRLICMPHPAYRVVTNDLLDVVRGLVLSDSPHNSRVKQHRGFVSVARI
jgi:hypothetical protein